MTKKKRQLIFLWMYVEWGGAQIYLLAIMKEALADWDIVVILPRNSLSDIVGYIENIGVRYEFIDASLDSARAVTIKWKMRRQWRRFYTEIAILRHLKKYNLRESILHVETLPWQSWQFLTALSLLGANVFVTLHNALPKLPAWRELILKTRMKFVSRLPGFHIFTSNKDTKEKFRGWVAEKFWERIPVTYTCVNPDEIDEARAAEFDCDAARAEHGIDAGAFVVLGVGQFIDRKGRWTFLDAARRNAGCQPASHTQAGSLRSEVFVWLTPKMPDDADFRRVEEYGLGDRFRLILSADVGGKRADILRFFRIADCFALPSFVEGLPIALLEAMALGIPSISTNINAIPEAVKHLETGLLIEAGDSDALADAILDLKENAELRQDLSERGRAYVLANFDERAASQIAIDAYEECFKDA